MCACALYRSHGSGRLRFEVIAPCIARDMLLLLGISRPAAADVFATGRLVRAGEALDPHTCLDQGDQVDLYLLAVHPERRACPDDLEVLHEDPFALAVSKPAGLLVHGDGTGAPTLADHVAAYLDGRGELYAPQAVQRLDVDTTGVVLFSKTREFQPLFDALVSGHDMCKRYVAVVEGAFPRKRAVYTAAIARDRHDARRMRVTTTGGQSACTHVEFLAATPDGRRSLLLVTLGSGRKHQIRVHLSAHGYPIVGDVLYGGSRAPGGLMLHAYDETFEHPVTHVPVRLCAGWPRRFSQWFDPQILECMPTPSESQEAVVRATGRVSQAPHCSMRSHPAEKHAGPTKKGPRHGAAR